MLLEGFFKNITLIMAFPIENSFSFAFWIKFKLLSMAFKYSLHGLTL